MNVVQQFNRLNGTTVSREEISRIIAMAKENEQFQIVQDLEPLLKYDDKEFIFDIQKPAFEIVPESLLNCLDCEEIQDDAKGLGKSVSPTEIYDLVTDLIINTIKKVGHLPWQKEWIGSGSDMQAKNYVTKRPYSGINHIFLNFDVVPDPHNPGYSLLVPINFVQPYYLTFNQIKEAKATLKKGSKAHSVFYYTMIYDFKRDNLEFKTSDSKKWNEFIKKNNLTAKDILIYARKFPMLKYYNVFRADDCTGLKFPPKPKPKNISPIDQAQEIIDGYPNPPKYTFIGSDAYYQPQSDTVNMPKITAFTKEEFYYSTYFHELVHSTGHSKRLNRGNDTRQRDGGAEDKKAYAFEELVAELGAVFLCSNSGILFTTVDNSAKYLKGWNSRLITELENDNRFFMKASAMAQKAVNLILNLDENGNVQEKAKKIEKKPIIKNENPAKKGILPISNGQKKTKNPIIPKNKFTKNQLVKVVFGECKNHIGRVLHCSYDQDNDILIYEIENACSKEIPENMLVKSSISQLPIKPVIPSPKKTKQELEAINPKPFAIKPKNVSVATAVNDVLTTGKYKNIKPLQANVFFNIFKDLPENTDFFEVNDKFKIGVLGTLPFDYAVNYEGEWFGDKSGYFNLIVEPTDYGWGFINAVKNRLESLRNQKNNYSFFDGLTGNQSEDHAWFPKYSQFKNKPKEAIKHLLKVKKGDCLSALHRESIGYIDIVWGENDKNNKGFGLKHIVEKHGKEIAQLGFKVEDFIPMVVKFGIFKESKTENKIELSGKMFKIIISKVAYRDGKKENKVFVLSAFDLRPLWKKGKLSGINGTYDGINFTVNPLRLPTPNFNKGIKKINNFTKKPLKGITENIVANVVANALLSPAKKTAKKKLNNPDPGTIALNPNSLAYKMQNKGKVKHEYYIIPNKEIANFLGKVEKKQKESVAITIAGGQGSMKTRLCFQLMDAFAQNYKVGHASIEEHPNSALYDSKVEQYLSNKALPNIENPEINNINDVHSLVKNNDVIIIDSFSKLQEMQRGCELDKDFRKAYDGKLFIIIYQLTGDGKMRGGSKSQFDGDIICFVEKQPNYKDNYVQANKNRYQSENLEELKFNIFSGSLVPIEKHEKEQLAEKFTFSFNAQ